MKPVPSAPGYFACEDGHIWRRGSRRVAMTNGRGYLRIKVSVKNTQRDAYIHRLVCEAYHGPCPEGMQCRHLDGDRKNNRPCNLQWADKKTNEADKAGHGTLMRGDGHASSKLTGEVVMYARQCATDGETVASIADRLGVGYGALNDAVRGRRWKHLPGHVPLADKRAPRNQRMRSDNSSGYRGVSRESKTGKWYARILIGGVVRYLGTFSTPEAASVAYEEASSIYSKPRPAHLIGAAEVVNFRRAKG